jgi:hypothetical protein
VDGDGVGLFEDGGSTCAGMRKISHEGLSIMVGTQW